MRPGDVAMPAGPRAIAVMLPEARDNDAATILGAAVRAGGLPRCAFGMTWCPGDGVDAAGLLELAARRLDDAIAARDPSTGRD